MNTMVEAVVTVALAIAGVAMLSVLVSKKAQTPQVIQAAGSAYSNALGVAISPVTGETYSLNLNYPGSNSFTAFTMPSLNNYGA